MTRFHLHLVSDSTGETVSSVARAALVQFEGIDPEEHVWSLVRTKTQMERVIQGIEDNPGIVMYTLVDEEMINALAKVCKKNGHPCIPVIASTVDELSHFLGKETKAKPGKQYKLTEEYFERVEAINFALAHDDGQAHWELSESDIVVVGPSRTSKSPTCIYLANRGYKAANVPFVTDCPLPKELFELKNTFIVGLTISEERLQQIRKSRLQAIKQEEESNYVDVEYINGELTASRKLFHQQRWPIIDVSKRSVEETAATILQYYQKHKDRLRNTET